VDGSIGLRDRLSFTSGWEGKRPVPLLIDLPLLWRLLRQALLAAARWPREVGHHAGALQIVLSLGNLAESVIVYPADAPVPRSWNRQPTWDVPHIDWAASQDVNDLLDQLCASLARHLQFGAYPAYRKAIRADAAE
jgi:hypothetical protein